jgi:hypothetical protein
MPTAMNPNPYPQGRWTQFAVAIATKKSKNRLLQEPVAVGEQKTELGRSRASELFPPDELDLHPQVRRDLVVA